METLFILFIFAFLIGIKASNIKKTNNETVVNDKVYYHYHTTTNSTTTINGKIVNNPETLKEIDTIFKGAFNKHFTK